jgi:multiple sugar transport system permease protein
VAAVAARAAPGRARRRRKLRLYGLVTLFMSPWLVGFLAFFLYPMAISLWFAFTRYDFIQNPVYVGLANFRQLWSDPFFRSAVANTLWIVLILVPIKLVFAILTATLLTAPVRGVRWYRLVFYLPTMVPPVAATLAFVYLLNPNGPLDQGLGRVGITGPAWFYDPTYSKWGLVLLALWGVGDTMIIFLAGLLNVPRTLYEAALLDGARAFRRFWHVTLPMISPVIFFSLVIGIINAFQYFTEAYVAEFAINDNPDTVGTGEPEGSLLFYATYLYKNGFFYFKAGYASAMAWLLFAATMVCTALLLKTSKRWVHYQGGFR